MAAASALPSKGMSVVPIRQRSPSKGIDEDDALVAILQEIGLLARRQNFRVTIWLPLTRRTRFSHVPPALRSTLSTQGPAALTSAVARAPRSSPVVELAKPTVQPLASRRAEVKCGPQPDDAAAQLGVQRVQDDQPGVVDPAIGIFEGLAKFPADRGALRSAPQIQRARRRQFFAPAQMIVEEQSHADEPGRPHVRDCAAARSASAR